ncbi:helix-turn-helix transcriptional regulator [Streptomyces sp. B1866]|uniref:helix-turn-helix domain-containing protein n=1 Tax=Streptomyces sp. B1866 TaxID=3075431 RepID=UPI00288D2718|nr:helix-turn-helix transcriptional regulator [Streptomyces sp. B1866]MDT3399889.1 helix-turn-helix transcriptional regulator [Streptomyces sp. B1866]
MTAHEATGTAAAPLSERQREVLVLVAQGHTPAEAAAALGLSTNTVYSYLRVSGGKLGVPERPGLVHAAYTTGQLLPPPRDDRDCPQIPARQLTLLDLLADGAQVRQAAARLRISARRTRREIDALCAVLDARTAVHAVTRGWQLGLLGTPRHTRGAATPGANTGTETSCR